MEENISEKEFNILENIVHGVMYTDLRGHIIYWNPANVKIFGYDKSEAQGMSVRTLYDEDEKLPFRQLLEEVIKDAPLQVNWHGIRKNNSRVWLDIRANLLKAENGETDGCVISLHIIDEKIRTKSKLEKNRAFAEAILETSADAILSVDENGNIIRLNDAAVSLFGYEKEELIGRSVEILIPESYSEITEKYLQKIQKGNGQKISERGLEIETLKKDGTEFPSELSIAEVTWDGKKIYTAIIKDLTQRRELERSIIKIGSEERRKIGRELHDGVGQMLTGIRLLSETVAGKLKARNEVAADEVREIAEMVEEADDYVRDLSRGMVVTELESKGLLTAIESLCARTEKAVGIECAYSMDDKLEFEDLDIAMHLFRIIQEAVNNAVKHSGADNIEIELTINPHLAVIVEDDGEGFDVDDNSLSGTGLQIMKYRAKILGGHFEISRTDENKTRMKCDFPALKG